MVKDIKQTIKRAYDQYKPQDFSVGLDNLNPKREMLLDKMAEIENKVQELTNDIVRKKIKPKEAPEEKIQAVAGGETPSGSNQFRKAKVDRAGGSLFGDIPKDLEVLIGAFPGSIDVLSKPPVIDCDPILQKYDFATDYEVYEEEAEDSSTTTYTYKITTSSESTIEEDDEENEDDDSPVEDSDGDADECASIELTWLKLILIILKIIRILLIIIDQVISTIITIIQIVCLAVGAWLNPPNIAQIVQIILGIVIALVVKMIAMLIQALWDMLNLDCLADQVMEVIAQIQECMDAFKSTLGLLNPEAITFFSDLLVNGMSDMKDVIKQLLKAKGEAWAEAVDEIRKTFEPENLKKMKDQLEDGVIDGVLSSIGDTSGGKVTVSRNADGELVVGGTMKSAVEQVVNSAQSIDKETRKKFNQTVAAATDAYNMIIKGQQTQSSNTAVKSALKDISIQGLNLE